MSSLVFLILQLATNPPMNQFDSQWNRDVFGVEHGTECVWGGTRNRACLGWNTEQSVFGVEHGTERVWGGTRNRDVSGVEHGTERVWSGTWNRAGLGWNMEQGRFGVEHGTGTVWGGTSPRMIPFGCAGGCQVRHTEEVRTSGNRIPTGGPGTKGHEQRSSAEQERNRIQKVIELQNRMGINGTRANQFFTIIFLIIIGNPQ